MKKLILTLLPTLLFSQAGSVGVNTAQPQQTLDVNGTMAIRNTPTATSNYSVLVIDETTKQVKTVSVSALNLNTGTCPNFLKNQSSGYHIKFSSAYSVPNPNSSLTIQGKNFVSAGTYIESNTYYYSWSSTTGNPININNFTVNFGNLTCTYNQ